MSNVVSRGESSTSAENTTLTNLTNLTASGSSQAIRKTGQTTFANVDVGTGTGGSGAIIAATDSGNHKAYSLAQAPTTSAYFVIVNGGSYTTDDLAFGFTVSGTTLTFTTTLASDVAGAIIKLVCV